MGDIEWQFRTRVRQTSVEGRAWGDRSPVHSASHLGASSGMNECCHFNSGLIDISKILRRNACGSGVLLDGVPARGGRRR